jgi:hypothetical protein
MPRLEVFRISRHGCILAYLVVLCWRPLWTGSVQRWWILDCRAELPKAWQGIFTREHARQVIGWALVCDLAFFIEARCFFQALSGSASPQSLVPASQRLPNGLRYDSVSGYAKAAAVTGGKQLLGLGEAGYKYVSSQYGQWRSGSWEGASTR